MISVLERYARPPRPPCPRGAAERGTSGRRPRRPSPGFRQGTRSETLPPRFPSSRLAPTKPFRRPYSGELEDTFPWCAAGRGANRCDCRTAPRARRSRLPRRARSRCGLGRSGGGWIHRRRRARVAGGWSQRSANPSTGRSGLSGGREQRVRLPRLGTVLRRGRGCKERRWFSCRSPAQGRVNRRIKVRKEAPGCIDEGARAPAGVVALGRRPR